MLGQVKEEMYCGKVIRRTGNEQREEVMSDKQYIVFYLLLFLFINIGFIIKHIINSRFFKSNFSTVELEVIKKNSKKWIIVSIITILLLIVSLITLYIFSPKYILIIQFLILFFIISFVLSFISYLQRYLRSVRKLKDKLMEKVLGNKEIVMEMV